jgi:hypothetical protein
MLKLVMAARGMRGREAFSLRQGADAKSQPN